LKCTDHIKHYTFDGEYYDYFTVDKFMEQENKRRYQEIISLCDLKNHNSLLEVGSGGGPAIRVLRNKNVVYFPIDIATNNLKKMMETSPNKIFPASATVFSLPFKNESFNNVIMSEVLEHLDDPKMALSETSRVLKNKGKLIISVPYNETIKYEICIHCNKPTPIHSHLHSFDLKSLEKLATEVGLTPIKSSKNLNKITNRLYLNRLLKHLPYPSWKLIDKLFNILIDKSISLILVCGKN